MSTLYATPKFGAPLKPADYYENISSILKLLRPAATLRQMANYLNSAGFLTPSGLPWTRERVSNYLRNKAD